MSMLRVLCSAGDKQLVWDADAALKGDEEALAAIREAERISTMSALVAAPHGIYGSARHLSPWRHLTHRLSTSL